MVKGQCFVHRTLYFYPLYRKCMVAYLFPLCITHKDLNSTVAKRGSVFIGLMTPDGAIWFSNQRAVLMR